MKRVLLLAVGALALTACASDAPSSQINTATVGAGSNGTATGDVVDIKMVDMAYEPNTLTVAKGDTVTFRFTNDSAVQHEAAIGTLEQQDEHHAEMAAAATGAGMTGHDMSAMSDSSDKTGHGMTGHDMSGENGVHGVTVEPGQTVELTHTFDTPGEILVGCHVPGHWEAGMKMTINVA